MDRIAFFRERQKAWQMDPVLFFREVLRFEPDDWQADVGQDLASSNRVTVKSGHGVGKTALSAGLALWFLTCFPYSRVVATAPTRQQLHDVLWSEIAKWQNKSPLLSAILKWTKTYIYMVGMEKRWFAVARTATKPENMQGFHEDNMLFIVDEASGVADIIMEAILATLSGANNKLLLLGNPTKNTGTFHDSHTKDRFLYRAHTVNALNSNRTNKENIEANIKKYGRESNFVRVRVFGDFPLQEDDVFIPLSLIENSVQFVEPKVGKGDEPVPIESIHIGCDVARFGDDKTVIGYKVNERVNFHKKINGQDLMRTAADCVFLGETLRKTYGYDKKIPLKIDVGGIGAGVVDRLRQIKRGNPNHYWWMEIIPVDFGLTLKRGPYHDSTTYMMAVVRELLSPIDEDGNKKDVDLILPNDNDLIAQLSTRKFDMTEKNKLKVESKKEMKKRGLPSPDEADCVLLCCLPVKFKNDSE